MRFDLAPYQGFSFLLYILILLASCSLFAEKSTSVCIDTIPVNVVVLDKGAFKKIDSKDAQKWMGLLNEGFVSQQGKKYFEFKLKAFAGLAKVKSSTCLELASLGFQEKKPSRADVVEAFDACSDTALADPSAINVYVFHSTFDENEIRKSSRIYFSGMKPFIFMNTERLDNDWAVWQHEFGHAFGLPEHYVCGAGPEALSNIMSKPKEENCTGTGGDRKIGFYSWQSAIIESVACLHATWIKRVTRQ